MLEHAQGITKVRPLPQLCLVTASGEPLVVHDYISAEVKPDKTKVKHNFVAVNKLVTPIILGVDFLRANQLMLNFSFNPVHVQGFKPNTVQPPPQLPTSRVFNHNKEPKHRLLLLQLVKMNPLL